MAIATTITARESPGGPPPGLKGISKLRWSVKNPPAEPNVTFEGKTVLVTGANAGLGFQAAVKYAEKGASKLILAVRSVAKGEEAKQAIAQRSGRHPSFITVLPVDLSSYASVQKFITALEGKAPQLDVVLLNAGLANPTFIKSAEGYEMALQVNVLSTALMAVLLLPLLRKTAAAKEVTPHLTFVNSIGHEEVKKDWYSDSGSLLRRANDQSKYDATKTYSMVKLLGMAAMKAIAKATTKPDGTPEVVVNACCPFMCRTDLGRNFPLPLKAFMAGFQYFTARSAEEGSRTLVGATALGPESQGRFWHHDILHP